MAIRNVYIVADGTNIIESAGEINDTTYVVPTGYHLEDMRYPENPTYLQNPGMLFDPDFEWKFYADNTTGEFKGRWPYPGYTGDPQPPANTTAVISMPPDVAPNYNNLDSQLRWSFEGNVWFWPEASLKAKALESYYEAKENNNVIEILGKQMNTLPGWITYYLARRAVAQNGPALSTRKILFDSGKEIAEMSNETIVTQIDAYLEDLQRWDNALAVVYTQIEAEDSTAITVPDNLTDHLMTEYNAL